MTTYIEDLILDLNSYVKVNSFDSNVVGSFSYQIFSGKGFTEKQSLLALRILKKYQNSLETAIKRSISNELSNPQYRFTIRKTSSTPVKRVYIGDHPQWGRSIKAEFPYNDDKVNQIRKSRENVGLAAWDGESKSWNFTLNEASIQFVHNLTKDEGFDYDDEFKNYLSQIEEIVNNMEKFIPMLVLDGETVNYKNVSDHIPLLDNTDVISSIFSARKSGIYTWDEKVNQLLEEKKVHPVIKKFLDNDYTGPFEIDSTVEPINCLKDIVDYMSPCLFVIPGGSELEKTTMIYNFLTSLGYTYDQMSIMFRLPSSEGKKFNDFVKNCCLNNPITDKTKFVFVSIKMPKPVLKSNINFNSIVSLGRSNVHYTIREYFKNRNNLIYYCEPSKQKEFNFGDL